MKKLFTILFLFVSFIALSQNNGINFQGVGRNSSGAVLASTKISLRFSVIQSSETGTVEYVESKEVTTNAQGIFSVVIGDGTQISKTGNFSDINWKINPKFLKVEMDPTGGTSYVAMGTTRLQAVPFAYYANGVNADNVDGVLSASKGGTGVASISALKTALAIDQINNTSDLAKPISTATQAALDTKVSTSTFSTTMAAKANISDLDLKANLADLASKANLADVALKANTSDLALKAPINSPTFTGTVSGITKAMVGLGYVDNTSDLEKPISTATQVALENKSNKDSTSFSKDILINGVRVGRGPNNLENTVLGKLSFTRNTTGYGNTAVGLRALLNNTVENSNTAIGNYSLNSDSLKVGSNNVAIGSQTLRYNDAGNNNVAVGNFALYSNGVGSNNTALGYSADISHPTLSVSNSTAIGSNAKVSTSNTIQLGNVDITRVITSGKIFAGSIENTPIGTISPTLGVFTDLAINGTAFGITKAMVGLSNVVNTSDLAKPISTATQEALDTKVSSTNFSTTIATKENSANKSTATDLGGSSTSDILFPTQKAVKIYVDTQISSGGVQDGGITTIKLADGAVGNSQLANNSISSSKIIDGTITSADINSNAAIPFSKLNIAKSDIVGLGIPGSDQNTTYTAGSGLTLSGTTFSIGTGAITSTSIADGTITNVDINTSAGIDYSKLNLAGSIISSDISNSAAIPFSKLNIAKSDIVGLGIPGSDLNTTYTAGSGLSLSGTTFSIGNNVLTSNYTGSPLINGTITANSFIGDGSNLTNIAISDNSVTDAKIVNGTITTSDLADASITNSKISGPVSIVNGGTGTSTLLTNGVILGNGTNTVQFVAPGASGNVLKSNGTTWISDASSGGATSLDNLTDAKNQGSSGTYDFTGGLIIGHKYLPNLFYGLRTTALGIGSVQNLNNGIDNTAIGYNSMKLLYQGDVNTAVGSQALYSVYSGSYNTAVGVKSLYSNTASQNVAIGYFSLYNNTTGSLNTAVGSQALQTNVTGIRNTAIGYYSLGASTGDYNTATGFYSLYQNTTGYGNSGFGIEALSSNTSGYYNTSIGYQAGIQLTTGNNNTLIGYNSQPSLATVNNEITLGNSSITKLRSMVTSITSLSDRRDKTDIIDITEGLNFIKQLKPVSFTWNTRDKSKVGIKAAGFIAQDLLALQKSSSIGDNLDLVSEDNPEKLEARYNNLLPVMVKAIQDQQAIIDELKKELEAIKKLIQKP